MKTKKVNRVNMLKRELENKKIDWSRKLLALISLSKIASDEAFDVLRQYYFNPDPQMRVYAKLAFAEAVMNQKTI
ncbi:MAG: hypothetical protein ABIH50_03470 [bacterium]